MSAVNMSEQKARRLAAAAGIDLSIDPSLAKEEAKLFIDDPEVIENADLYVAIYFMSNLMLEKVVRTTVEQLQRDARRHKITRSKPHRKTN